MTDAFGLADRFVEEVASLTPVLATNLGVPGHDHEWGESLSLRGFEELAALARRYRPEFEKFLDDPDPKQRLAARVTVGSIDERLVSFEEGDHFLSLRHLASSFHSISTVFTIMPTKTGEHWDAICSRLETIDKAYGDYRELLDVGRQRKVTVARRQVRSVSEQAAHLAGKDSAFLKILDTAESSRVLSERLERAVDHAREQAGAFSRWLIDSYLPDAVEEDGVGEEVYRRNADRLVGLTIDPKEAYGWGWDELNRLFGEMKRVGDRIVPGATVEEVRDHLESDPAEQAHSPEALVEYVTTLLEQAVTDLAGSHFDVPEGIRPLTVQIAPPGGPLSAYYIAPSEDLTRPGGVWYSIGDQTVFPKYQHTSTAYHEGFPGHHLQIATVKYRKDDLSRTQRSLTWYPGYSEGWGMYAEVLMGELGYLEDPKNYFGMLAKQAYRAARVVVDIGLHLGLRIDPSSAVAPGEIWGFDTAIETMKVYGFQTPSEAEAEVLRYLGWPAQAPTYKLGEREILSIRQENRDRLGSDFDLRKFHATVINNGSMRLDLLRQVVAEQLSPSSPE